VTSVDGVNVLSGATAAFDQTGYVFEAGERYEITGWRKSDSEVAAFTFTNLPDSYAARTGRPATVGVIGVALFRERRPPSVWVPPRSPVLPEAPVAREREVDSLAGKAQSAPASPAASDRALADVARPAPAPLAKLGTGHGEREYSYVNHTDFARQQPEPNEIIRIRYDSLENLLAMGVVKRPRPLPPTMNPFPGSAEREYVPDPPG
jgi:hypothetical protein